MVPYDHAQPADRERRRYGTSPGKDDTMMDAMAGVARTRWLGRGTNTVRWATLAALFTLLLGAYPGTVLKADNLRWKFRQGEVVRYTIVQETTLEERLEGQEGKTSLSQTVDLHWTVKSLLPDG